MLLKIPTPSAICLSGASSSGKSSLVHKIIQCIEEFYTQPPKTIIYCYSQHQKLFEIIEKECSIITFHKGLPTIEIIDGLAEQHDREGSSSLLILDDLQEQMLNSALISELFTVKSHHCLINLIYLKQNLYCKGKFSRTITLNTQIFFLLQNPRDINQVALLGNQIYGKNNILLLAYKKAMEMKPYNYLLVNLHPKWDVKYQLCTDFFAPCITIFQPI